MRAKKIGWMLVLSLIVVITACAPAVGPSPQPKALTVDLDRAANTVDVSGDVGPFTIKVGANTDTDTDGIDIPLGGLNLSSTALTNVTVTSADGLATFSAMAPLATSTENQEALRAKLDYVVYALSALYNSGALSTNPTQEAAAYDMLWQMDTALNSAFGNGVDPGYVVDEATAVNFESSPVYGDGATERTTQQSLEFANSTYLLPNMEAIMTWFDANPTDAAIFKEGMLKVWWNKLDTANDAALNIVIEAEIKALHPDVNSIL